MIKNDLVGISLCCGHNLPPAPLPHIIPDWNRIYLSAKMLVGTNAPSSSGPDSTGMFPVLIFSQFICGKETLLNVNVNETKNFLVCENWFDPPHIQILS